MNRKILAVLLVAPVLVFATDRVMTLSGKNTPTAVKEKISAPVNENLELAHNSQFTSEEIISEMKASILDREGRQRTFEETDYTGTWDEEKVKGDLGKFVKARVVNQLERNNICSIDLKKSFSRCPSGYDAYIIVQDDHITNEGWMIARSGCDFDPIAKFRYDMPASKVEAKVSDKVGYLPLDEFFKVYKAAAKSL